MEIERAGLLRDGSRAERWDKPVCLIIYSSGSIGFLAQLGGNVQGPLGYSTLHLRFCGCVAVSASFSILIN
jgi:hypothetical protein